MEDFTIHLTSDLTSSERRLSPDWTLKYFKHRVEYITGIPPESQKIWIYETNDSNEREQIDSLLNEETTLLEDLHISPFTRIHIESTSNDPDMIQLQKELLNPEDQDEEGLFKLEEKRYDEMAHTVKKWKLEKKLGRYDPAFTGKIQELLEENEVKAKTIRVGDRCKLHNSSFERLGTVRYVGKIPEINNENSWVGVELDEPYGKNDGSIKGVKYFTCKLNYGSFVKPIVVETGDFPQEKLDFNSDEEEDEL
ncbi:hypothetical protein FOA43_000698 [Brettanomyces nanus]|uniref:CAP-Gly domain-containing protein n=1 Tax=Eeniella nana TaxID=13502 RepID=A0A875RXL4_EENNA|nr:uncharacterized protein FOA43_000698 [Brettanomyces nanus]QPG73388.1 hypothetical protein FOA43_000698 [Brettanomyces nanus]